MVPFEKESKGVSGTVEAFNFIRRVGFPPSAEVISMFMTITILATVTSLPLSGLSLTSTLQVTTSAIILPTLLGSFLSAAILLRGEPVLNFRRLMGMEMIAWSPVLVFLPLYSLLGTSTGNQDLWKDGLFVSVALSIPVRLLTIFSMSGMAPGRKLASSALVPALVFFLFAFLANPAISSPANASLGLGASIAREAPALMVLLIAGLLSWGGVVGIIRSVDGQGSSIIRDAPMGLFRDFLRHWLKGEGGPLENRLGALGRTGRINVSTLVFEGSEGLRTGVVISNFHPGPYRDLGSGGLPSMLKSGVESKNNTIIMVPHGISNHEYNIISHADIQSLVNEACLKYPIADNSANGSKLVREVSGDAKATAQIFGNIVFLTLTLAPIDMEDIPTEVNEALKAEAKARGLTAIVADAHNSLNTQVFINETQATMLADAGIKALTAVSLLPRSTFKVGAASHPLREFRLEDGIGPGGLTELIIECQGQRIAYITIDGNNMQQGFRQTLLEELHGEGMDDGEVMTTDTHLVAGVVRSPLGYRPVGEGINRELLVTRVRETARAGAAKMEEGSMGFGTFELDLKVLGSESFRSITSFVGRVARRIGRSFLKLELLVATVSVIVLLVL